MVVVNNTVPREESGSGMGFLLGIILLIVFLFALFYYGLPALQSVGNGPQLNVPSKVDINVNQK